MGPPCPRLVKAYSRFEIVRIRNFLSHDHGQVAEVDMEITIRSGEESNHIVLELDRFLPNLRMVDASGEEYPLMSNKHLRITLEDGAAAGVDHPGIASLLADINNRKTHLLWFAVPPHKALQANEVRVLHLTYEHSKKECGLRDAIRRLWTGRRRDLAHEVASAGPWGTIQRLWTGVIMISIPPALPFPTFWILGRPADYNISRRRYSRVEDGVLKSMGSWEANADAVFCESTAKSESLHVKPDTNGAALYYTLTPKKIVLALPVAAIFMLSLLAVSLWASPHVVDGDPLWHIADAIVRHEMPLLLFIVASSLVVPRFIDDAHLRNGLLWMYFVPIGLALGSVLL